MKYLHRSDLSGLLKHLKDDQMFVSHLTKLNRSGIRERRSMRQQSWANTTEQPNNRLIVTTVFTSQLSRTRVESITLQWLLQTDQKWFIKYYKTWAYLLSLVSDVFWRKAADNTKVVRSHVGVCVLLRTTWMTNHIYIFIMGKKKFPGDHRKQRRKTLLTETNSCVQESGTDLGTSHVVLHAVQFSPKIVTCPVTSCSAPSLKTVPFFGHACVVIFLHHGWIGLWQRTWRNHKVDNKPEYKPGARFVETRSVDDDYIIIHLFLLKFPFWW